MKWKSEKYRRFIASKPCMHCGAVEVQCAHIRAGHSGGMGMKPPDYLTVPLCPECHHVFDANQKANPGFLVRAFVKAAELHFEWREALEGK